MMRRSSAAIALALLIAVVATAACGGEDAQADPTATTAKATSASATSPVAPSPTSTATPTAAPTSTPAAQAAPGSMADAFLNHLLPAERECVLKVATKQQLNVAFATLMGPSNTEPAAQLGALNFGNCGADGDFPNRGQVGVLKALVQGFASQPAPQSLGQVSLPRDAAQIRALLARMPASLAGRPRASQIEMNKNTEESISAIYQDPAQPLALLELQASDSRTRFPVPVKAGEGVAFFYMESLLEMGEPAPGAPWPVAAGHDGSLVWAQSSLTISGRAYHIAVWGDADGVWTFRAEGRTQEELSALIGAFVAAAGR